MSTQPTISVYLVKVEIFNILFNGGDIPASEFVFLDGPASQIVDSGEICPIGFANLPIFVAVHESADAIVRENLSD